MAMDRPSAMIARFVQDLANNHPKSVVHVERLPERDAQWAQPDPPLPDRLQAVLDDRGLKLYTHQAETIAHVRAGRHVLVTTPTASGKTLCFNLTNRPRSRTWTSLWIYPRNHASTTATRPRVSGPASARTHGSS